MLLFCRLNYMNYLLGSSNNVNSFLFNISSLLLVSAFLFFRFPYKYGGIFFMVFLFFIMLPLFLSLFFSRLESDVNSFFSSFMPFGSPLWIAPLVSFAEGLSYVIRPAVLIARPFLNITMGALGSSVMGVFSIKNPLILVLLFFVFFYEVFVALIHWFMVLSILSFSLDH